MKWFFSLKKIVLLVCCIWALPTGLTFAIPNDTNWAHEAGEIRGKVAYCGPGGAASVDVVVPGQSFRAMTDGNGKFIMSYVPLGQWPLVFVKNGQRLGTIEQVPVLRREATDINQLFGDLTFCRDLDGDTYPPDIDCNDSNPNIHPNALERCGDGLDNNCDGQTDENCPSCTDTDGDGFYAQQFCGFRDCNDNNPAINPSAQESCGDGIDNDCDGQVDENDAYNALSYYLDSDGDGIGDSLFKETFCNPPDGYVTASGDCNDADPQIFPGAEERCNGVDDNCNDQVDDNCTNRICTDVEVALIESCLNQCGGNPTCTMSCLNNSGNLSQECSAANLQLSMCAVNAQCNLGNGVDAFFLCAFDYCPSQWEGVFGSYVPTECTDGATRSCGTDVGTCQSGQQTCSNGRWPQDCPGSIPPDDEICDDLDNNCDGAVDNDPLDGQSFFIDLDQDGYGDSIPDLACIQGPQHALVNGDCDDWNPAINPGAPEVCDEIDNNCNGLTDEDLPALQLEDWDGDGYGNREHAIVSCEPQLGFVFDSESNGYYDCDDNDPQSYPGAPEICDGRDNNCDGGIDEGLESQTWYRDNDGDGYGSDHFTVSDCQQPLGYVAIGGDCWDMIGYSHVNPAAEEICGDGLDNNCDGVNEMNTVCINQVGVCAGSTTACGGTCNDSDYSAHDPNYQSVETRCDGFDNDCDGQVDEGC